ncbi:TOM1-like protein 1 isoform X1 [Thamnophis elegans]|uniref:TOM1-like protein 1 isoform X1 n=2 Tax=Thamnophis elegans TaxID=35005 RepID=UPI00137722A7|nr:TOM1-like protein 1 isoform X1 [Thamnophis elegans]
MAFGKSQKDAFGTPIGHLIEKATFGTLQTEEWGQFMHICDLINTTEEGPKDAVRALKKRLSKNCNHVEIHLTLSLLEMCMKNCGPSFQTLIVKRDFCKDRLVKLLNPKFNLPVNLQEKILTFIMTWAKGFQNAVDVSDVKEAYLELLKKGVEFPSSEINRRTTKPLSTRISYNSSQKCLSKPLSPAAVITLIPEQVGKLYSELDMVKMNVRVMSAILKENVPGAENPDDMALLQKLYKTSRTMQDRIMELLATVENEDVITELIQMNENLNNVLLGHERFSRNRVRFWENQRILNERAAAGGNQPSAPSCDLLDFESCLPAAVPKPMRTDLLQSSELNYPPQSVVDPHPHSAVPSIYPHLNSLGIANASQSSFPTEVQWPSQVIPNDPMYINVNKCLNPEPLHAVNHLSNGTGNAPPGDISKTNPHPPNYYELMEFDPLAPCDPTKHIYEEIDPHLFKTQVNIKC